MVSHYSQSGTHTETQAYLEHHILLPKLLRVLLFFFNRMRQKL